MSGLTSWSPTVETQVCICGIGARTPLGFDAAASAAAVRGGVSAVEAHERFIDQAGEPMSLAADADLDGAASIGERLQQMLLSAVEEAVEPNVARQPKAQMRCWVAVPEHRPGMPENVTLTIARSLSALDELRHTAIQVLPFGHAAGLMAIEAAARTIASGEVEIALVAATDSYHDSTTLDWLDRAGLLMSAENRNGFPPGEGAGACVLANRHAARRYGFPVLGQIAAVATSFEPKSIRGTSVCIGEALTETLKHVTSSLDLPREAITETYCDLNGERYRNEEFVYTLLRVQDAFVDAHNYTCPADCWGDVGAASGPLFLALAIIASSRGYAAGNLPLLWAGSESGYRSAVVLRLREKSGEDLS